MSLGIMRPIDRADLALIRSLVWGLDLPNPQGPHLPRLEDDEPGVRDEDLGVHSQDVPVSVPDPGHGPVCRQLHPALQEGRGPRLHIEETNQSSCSSEKQWLNN